MWRRGAIVVKLSSVEGRSSETARCVRVALFDQMTQELEGTRSGFRIEATPNVGVLENFWSRVSIRQVNSSENK